MKTKLETRNEIDDNRFKIRKTELLLKRPASSAVFLMILCCRRNSFRRATPCTLSPQGSLRSRVRFWLTISLRNWRIQLNSPMAVEDFSEKEKRTSLSESISTNDCYIRTANLQRILTISWRLNRPNRWQMTSRYRFGRDEDKPSRADDWLLVSWDALTPNKQWSELTQHLNSWKTFVNLQLTGIPFCLICLLWWDNWECRRGSSPCRLQTCSGLRLSKALPSSMGKVSHPKMSKTRPGQRSVAGCVATLSSQRVTSSIV